MKYREKYYDLFDAPACEVEEGLLFSSYDSSCGVCGENTNFYDVNFGSYACSEECTAKLWDKYCSDCAGCPEYCWDGAEVIQLDGVVCSRCEKIVSMTEEVIEYEASNGVFLKAIENTCIECGDITWKDWYQINGLESPLEIKNE